MREPPPHGTSAAYRAHTKRGERPCDPCRAANAALSRERRAILQACKDCGKVKRIEARDRCSLCYEKVPKRARNHPTRIDKEHRPHGTVAAYQGHKRYGETPCELCREAQREASRQRRAIMQVCVACGQLKKRAPRGLCVTCYAKVDKPLRRKA